MTNQTESQSLLEFVDRVTNVVTDLNGLISSILDEEVTVSDFENGLAGLFDKLAKVEATASELTAMTEPATLTKPEKLQPPDVETLMEWEEEGGCEATDGCWVEPDGTCPHGRKSWLLELGLI